MMRAGHHALSAPIAVTFAYFEPAPLWVKAATIPLIIYSSTWPDYDHSRFRHRANFPAMLVRVSARHLYRIRTRNDTIRTDEHRGPSHSIEWCALVSFLVGTIFYAIPPTREYALWFGVAIFLGTGSHILGDAMTPAGVPFSAFYNLIFYYEVWKRHAFGYFLPFGKHWYLRWIRIPIAMCVDERDTKHDPGWFRTDHGAEHQIVIPILYGVTIILALGFIGVLNPILGFLFNPVL